MNEKLLILTMHDPNYNAIAVQTLPAMRAYAVRCGVSFRCVTGGYPEGIPTNWHKVIEIRDALEEYDRVLYMDIDMIIRPDTQNLFNYVVSDCFAAFPESDLVERREMFTEYADHMGRSLLAWSGKYYNSGLMMIPKKYASVFAVDNQLMKDSMQLKAEQPDKHFHDQSYINIKLVEHNVTMQSLPIDFNVMHVAEHIWPERVYVAFIIHYAGLLNSMGMDALTGLIAKDLKEWSDRYDSEEADDQEKASEKGSQEGDQKDEELDFEEGFFDGGAEV